ncbi:aminoglycoside 3'-phosphotransferase [Cellulomonas alba]|uniref:Aminoglycoside 3'-phosphotransferase n=1 Tax=Cellulomonas alba TaxID=3053467 RepID=A0ABT7SDE9_9CELL|nr:aminoglycoside 3'-phosphotransferase [Cellulomonas alba]MDM7854213.1 aminoglycoside 3'-phosphotransferase [Cellulomonas alba]
MPTADPAERPAFLSGRPPGPVAVPRAVRALVGAAPDVVWRNELGGLTFRLSDSYLKWAPARSGLDLDAEARRLAWAGRWTPVPALLDQGSDDEGAWIVTRALAGRSAVDERWLAEPRTAARAIGAGLRAMHDALPADGCPFDWGVGARVEAARQRTAERRASGRLDAALEAELDRREAALDALPAAPPVDLLVVCHGDACAPNTLLDDEGRWSGHVDLGALGVADRWADLAVAARNTVWNYGPGYEDAVVEAYGVEPDDERAAFYRHLWDIT